MVKSNPPLQIRLTEPVIFLRGPSTGLDFRGRPQQMSDGQPALVRGLLTLRLHKTTRIRSIAISLEGKSRTEWPEGIGPRRTDLFEENIVVDDTTTFFSAAEAAKARGATRRSQSAGPGTLSQFDLDEDDIYAQDITDDEATPEARGRALPRSASVLPSNPSDWHGRSRSRRASWSLHSRHVSRHPSPERGPPSRQESSVSFADQRQESGVSLNALRLADRVPPGPSPLYTPSSSHSQSSAPSRASRPSSLRLDSAAIPHDHGSSRLGSAVSFPPESSDDHPSGSHAAEEGEGGGEGEWRPSTPTGQPNDPINFPLLDSEPATGSSVRFEPGAHPEHPQVEAEVVGHPVRRSSTRTVNSTNSSSHSSTHHADPSEYHPVVHDTMPCPTARTTPTGTPLPGTPLSASPRLMAQDALPRRPSGLRSASGQSTSNDASADPSNEPSPLTSTGPSPNESAEQLPHAPNSLRYGRFGGHMPTSLIEETSSATTDPHDFRGRHKHKFSIGAALRGLSQDVKDRVRSRPSSRPSSRPGSRASSRTRGGTETPFSNHFHLNDALASPALSRQSSRVPDRPSRSAAPDFGGRGERTRSRDRFRGSSPARDHDRGRSRSRWGFGRGDEADEDAHNWREFRKGTYNYPISFTIPPTAPPTIHAEFGTVVYRLKATVVRPGALTPNYVEEMELTMVAGPQEDDMEESENVIVERQWEDQMRYQIALSGKAFPIGGTIPVSIRLMPLNKCKIYRLTIALEEKTDYFALDKKVARHETPRRYVLFAARNESGKKDKPDPLLPILSDSMSAIKDSPLAVLARNAALNNPAEFANLSNPEDDVYASLLDPMGPWHLETDLHIPDCMTRIKFTTKHDNTNITIAHWLKVTIRVERGDDVAIDSKGRRKQFDIIIETPIKILDCRVNSHFNSLPSYNRLFTEPSAQGFGCARHRGEAAIGGHSRSNTINSGGQGPPAVTGSAPQTPVPTPATVAASISSLSHMHLPHLPNLGHLPHLPGTHREASPVPAPDDEDTLLERNIVYDRLVSGQLTESGEEPPTYGEAVANAIRSAQAASRSQSRVHSHTHSRAASRPPSVPGSRSASRAPSRNQSRTRLYIED